MHLIGSATGRDYPLGPLLARAGEGAVYRDAADATLLVKVFDVPPPSRTVEKLDLLSRFSPKPAFTALPLETVFDAATRCVVGYAQPFFDRASPLTRLLDSAGRKLLGCPDRIATRVTLCRLVAEAMARLHAANLVMGDVSDSNFLVGRNWFGRPSVAYVIDCNSLQVTLRTNRGNECYLSGVGTEGFMAPELQSADWSATRRTVFSDSFGLAVACWLLLFNGSHPFAVASPPADDVPPLGVRIERRLFPYAPAAPLPAGWTQLTLDPPLGILPSDVREMLFRTFSTADPRDRPTAEQWVTVLRRCESDPPSCRPIRNRAGESSPLATCLANAIPWVRTWGARGLVLAGLIVLTIFFPSLQHASQSPAAVEDGQRQPSADPSGPRSLRTKPARTRYVDPELFPEPVWNPPPRTKE